MVNKKVISRKIKNNKKSNGKLIILKEFVNTPFKEVKNTVVDSLEDNKATNTLISSKGVVLENEVGNNSKSSPRIIGDGKSTTTTNLESLGGVNGVLSDNVDKNNPANSSYSPKVNDSYSSGNNSQGSSSSRFRTSSVSEQGINTERILPRRIVSNNGGVMGVGSPVSNTPSVGRRIDVSDWADRNTTMGMQSNQGSFSQSPEYSSRDAYLKKIGEPDDEDNGFVKRRIKT